MARRRAAARTAWQAFVALAIGAGVLATGSPAVSAGASTAGLPAEEAPGVDDREVVATIDRHLRAAWRAEGVIPSKKAPDLAWARRAYLDMLGRIPTVSELEAFRAVPKKDRREWLVDHLLGYESLDERARWQATEWANLLIGRTGGGRQANADRDSFLVYLRESFEANKPYDELTEELITATGSVRQQDEDFNGATNFLADNMAENGVQATAKTSQVFLGMAVQCTQCHNHPFNERRQNQFWELNAFFRQTRARRQREDNRRYARIEDVDFYGEGRGPRAVLTSLPGQAERAESYYELRNGKLKVAYPVFVDGTPLAEVFEDRGLDHGDSGRLELVNRRQELAKLIVDSPEFARAAVNREWGRFFGYGFTTPVEDMGPHNPPTHPELLEELADAFRRSGHDLRRLARWIALSEAYSVDSRAGGSNRDDDPSLGVRPKFTRFYLRQLSAEQIYDSLLTATRADELVGVDRQEQARRNWLRQFTTAFGNDENGEATSFDGSIPQSLAMMNSPLMQRATALSRKRPQSRQANARPNREGPEKKDLGKMAMQENAKGDKAKEGMAMKRMREDDTPDYRKNNNKPNAGWDEPPGFLSSVAFDRSLNDKEKIERLYLAALARRPDRSELRVANRLLAANKGKTGEALRDVWWALLNSNEFILQH